MYYLRTRPAVNAIQFTVDKEKIDQSMIQNKEKIGSPIKIIYESDNKIILKDHNNIRFVYKEKEEPVIVCNNEDDCSMCGS